LHIFNSEYPILKGKRKEKINNNSVQNNTKEKEKKIDK